MLILHVACSPSAAKEIGSAQAQTFVTARDSHAIALDNQGSEVRNPEESRKCDLVGSRIDVP